MNEKRLRGFLYPKPCCSWLAFFEDILGEASKHVPCDKRPQPIKTIYIFGYNFHTKEKKRKERKSKNTTTTTTTTTQRSINQ